jgi:PAS domain S-box-containing protein
MAQLRRAEKELKWKMAFFEAQANSSIDGILVLDQQNRKVLQNQRMVELFKIPREMADNKDDTDQLRWVSGVIKNPDQFIEKVVYLNAHPNEISRDEIELKNGMVLDRYSSPVFGEDEIYYGRIWTFRDITERKRTENALRESEERFRSYFELGLIGMAISSPAKGWIEVNDHLCRILGYERSELLETAWDQLTHPDDLAASFANFTRVINAEADGYSMDKRFIRKDGQVVDTSVSTKCLRHPDGSVDYFVVLIQDITERKRLEAHLFQSQKMETVGKLAGGVAHEFNSIMTAIMGQSELLLYDLPPGSALCSGVVEIRKAAERAAALTQQLLAYGRKQLLRPEILDLNSVLADMESALRHVIGRDQEVRITLAPGLHRVEADLGQIQQVIMNIAMNAVDAMPNGGNLTFETGNVTLDATYVSCFPELNAGEYVMLALSDTGVGMTGAIKARVFEPFFSTKPVGQGAGLGLSTCYGILKQSGGHISVYSEPGRGTTFKIYLPQVESRSPVALQRLDSGGLPPGTETILLVEDDPALREMAATLLRRLGYTVLSAADGIEALSLKQQSSVGHIDLLFTDVVMPHMSGRELADRVQASHRHTRVLFTSAYTESATVHQGVLDKGVALLQKPFTPSALAHKIREVLDPPGPGRKKIGDYQ